MFTTEYDKCLREHGSGESLTNVRNKAVASFISLYGDFKNFRSWLLLKEK